MAGPSDPPDDQDEDAINKRHNIYYDTETGTLAAAYFYKDWPPRA